MTRRFRRTLMLLGALAFGPVAGVGFALAVRVSAWVLGGHVEGDGVVLAASLSGVVCLLGWVIAGHIAEAEWGKP